MGNTWQQEVYLYSQCPKWCWVGADSGHFGNHPGNPGLGWLGRTRSISWHLLCIPWLPAAWNKEAPVPRSGGKEGRGRVVAAGEASCRQDSDNQRMG